MEIDISNSKFKEEDFLDTVMIYRDTHKFRLFIAQYNQASAENLNCIVSDYKVKKGLAKNSDQNDVTYRIRIDGLTIKG